MNPLEEFEQVFLAKKKDGNFVLASSLSELNDIAKEHPDYFGESAGVDTGRIEKDENGEWIAVFRDEDGSIRYKMRFAERG